MLHLSGIEPALSDFSPNRKYLVGVSGGLDSVALLHSLVALGYKKLVVCHLNHGLRGRSSIADAHFVERITKRFDLAFEGDRVDTSTYAVQHKKSLELAARELRYRFFDQCARRHRCRRLFLAHHADDQIETCLFNYFRGSGLVGLCGMQVYTKAHNLEIVRPLLAITRKDIFKFATDAGIKYREDQSNISQIHTRNRIRHQVIPAIEKAFGPSFRQAVLRTAEILRAEQQWLASLIPEPTKGSLSCRILRTHTLALQRRIVRQWLIAHGIPEPGFDETTRVLSMLDAKAGPAKINLPGNHHARRRAGEIFIC